MKLIKNPFRKLSLTPLIVLVALVLCIDSSANGQSANFLTHDTVSPVYLYNPGRGENRLVYYRTGDEACLEAMPSPYVVSGRTTVTYSNPRGAHDATFGYGCLYKVVWDSEWTPAFNQVIDDLFAQKYMFASKLCPANYVWNSAVDKQYCIRAVPPQDHTCPKMNPIFPGTGSKIQEELDFSSLKFGTIFKRVYFSRNLFGVPGVLGQNWFLFPLDKKLIFKDIGGESYIYAFRSPNMSYQYVDSGISLVGKTNDANSLFRLSDTFLPAVYEYRDHNSGGVERYDGNGKILSIVERSGVEILVRYSVYDDSSSTSLPAGLPVSLEDSLGNHFELFYNDDFMLNKIVHSSGFEVTYFYEDPHDFTMLTGVGFSGGTNKEYRYEDSIVSVSSSFVDSNLLNNTTTAPVRFDKKNDNLNEDTYLKRILGSYSTRPLAAIIDEKGNTYSEWRYNSEGYAIEALHGNISMGTLDLDQIWDAVDPRVTYINPLGKETIYHYVDIAGARKLAKIEGVATSNCEGSFKEFSYGTSGFITSATDRNGEITDYTRNAIGQELTRTEAIGTPQERTITTEWHPTFNLRTKITEPGKETVFIYDAQGRLLSQASNALPLQ